MKTKNPLAPLLAVAALALATPSPARAVDGATWHDYAGSDPGVHPYALDGGHDLTSDGFILGSFTATAGPSVDDSKAPFIKINATAP